MFVNIVILLNNNITFKPYIYMRRRGIYAYKPRVAYTYRTSYIYAYMCIYALACATDVKLLSRDLRVEYLHLARTAVARRRARVN